MVLYKVLNDVYNEKIYIQPYKEINYFLQGDTEINGELVVSKKCSKIILTEGQRIIFGSMGLIKGCKKTKLILEGRQEVTKPSLIPVNAFIIDDGATFKNVEIVKINIY